MKDALEIITIIVAALLALCHAVYAVKYAQQNSIFGACFYGFFTLFFIGYVCLRLFMHEPRPTE